MVAVAMAVSVGSPARSYDAEAELQNLTKGFERQSLYMSPRGQVLMREISQANLISSLRAQAGDPERLFETNLCARGDDACVGDARLYDWQRRGYGLVAPVLFTARNGATLSGHVWATRTGPRRRPGVVITNGSIQAPEQAYWYAAQALAKSGYVVLTWDPQGQGQSDTVGSGVDIYEGTHSQTDGRPFYDGTVDALDFFLSTPARPFKPRPSCESGTSHAAKQHRRARSGLNARANPFSGLLDRSRIGLIGHSYGAGGVSYVGQADPRVSAIVAYDNLGGADPRRVIGEGTPKGCPADPSQRKAVPYTKPALGLSADYNVSVPHTNDPDPTEKSTASLAYSKAGVDTGQIVIRGGTHLDFSFLSNPGFPATLRGADLIAWYTVAWMDKYVKGDPKADIRLLTHRWRRDAAGAAVDPTGDPNDFSVYYRSRLDVRLESGARFRCEDLRSGCRGMVRQDGFRGRYSYLRLATSPDGQGSTRGARGLRQDAWR
ncbi:MAG: hypothetical protein WB767_13860 [Nocardioides sp.]